MNTHGAFVVEDVHRAVALMTIGFPATLHSTRYRPDGHAIRAFLFHEPNVEQPKLTANGVLTRYELGKLDVADPFRVALAAITERTSWLDFLHRATGWHRGTCWPFRLQPGGQYQWTQPQRGVVKTPHFHKAIAFHMAGWRLAAIDGQGEGNRHSVYVFDRYDDGGFDMLPIMQTLNNGSLAMDDPNHPIVVSVTALHNMSVTMDALKRNKILHYMRRGRHHVYYREDDADAVRQRVAKFLAAS